jgi:2-amino-4-hydroxy-6-hydroxymethyldihydropteridine diphosphokinase
MLKSSNAHGIFLGLGSNLGDRHAYLSEALRLLQKEGLLLVRSSSIYETQPVELLEQPDFLNMTCEVDTDLEAEELLDLCLAVEEEMGRKRSQPKGPRIVDIDILFYNQKVLRTDRISLPHPALPARKFVLIPIVEIAPEFIDPVSGSTMRELLENCKDRSNVRLSGSPDPVL